MLSIFTILITQIEISNGGLQSDELSELNGTGIHQRYTTINTITTALIRSINKDAFGPENENITTTERSEHINDIEQLTNDNETRVLNSESDSDNMRSVTNQTFNEPVGNTTQSSLNVTSSGGTLFHDVVSVAFISVGLIVSVLNMTLLLLLTQQENYAKTRISILY